MAIRMERDDDGRVAIWTEPEPGDRCVGRCIGVGKTLDDAKLDAISELNGDIADVEALTDEDIDEDEDEAHAREGRAS